MQYSIRSFILAFLASLLVAALPSRAQDTWTSVTATTSQNLWGIAYGAGQFVTVGEGGAILTSPDGLAWTARNSGTTQWLLAASYSSDLQRYVVVGDQGLVLTSPDAITWTVRTSGTTRRLNGIAYGGGRFLAVGEAGTACVSLDGTTWTSTAVGVTGGWLRGVVYGAGRFIISGEKRLAFAGAPGGSDSVVSTVLTTIDGAQFESATLPSPAGDLEALAFDGTQFVTSGPSLVAVTPASLPFTWQTKFVEASGLSNPPFHNFRGVTFFNNTWIAVGALFSSGGSNAPIVFASPSSPAQNAAGVPATTSFNAIAASSAVAVAVGQSGTVWRSVATQSAPQTFMISPSATIVATVGSTVQLLADARGSAPLTYQWSFNSRPIEGATAPTLTLSNLPPAASGSYAFTATNPLGTATSTFFLTVVSPLSLTPPVDPNFVTPLTGIPSLLAIQTDGKILLKGAITPTPSGGQPRLDLVRLNPDGSLDPTFQAIPNSTFIGLEVLADGRILVATPDANYFRLNANGTVDPTFSPVRLLGAHRVLADGRLINLSITSNTATLARYHRDGSPDSTYPPTSITLAPPSSDAVDPNYTSLSTDVNPHGQIVVAASAYEQVGTGVFGKNETKIFRLNADGTLDATFPLVTFPASTRQFVVAGEKYYFLSAKFTVLGSNARYTVTRLLSDGAPIQPIIPCSWVAVSRSSRSFNWPPMAACISPPPTPDRSIATIPRACEIANSPRASPAPSASVGCSPSTADVCSPPEISPSSTARPPPTSPASSPTPTPPRRGSPIFPFASSPAPVTKPSSSALSSPVRETNPCFSAASVPPFLSSAFLILSPIRNSRSSNPTAPCGSPTTIGPTAPMPPPSPPRAHRSVPSPSRLDRRTPPPSPHSRLERSPPKSAPMVRPVSPSLRVTTRVAHRPTTPLRASSIFRRGPTPVSPKPPSSRASQSAGRM